MENISSYGLVDFQGLSPSILLMFIYEAEFTTANDMMM
jgi:hypothetical protein